MPIPTSIAVCEGGVDCDEPEERQGLVLGTMRGGVCLNRLPPHTGPKTAGSAFHDGGELLSLPMAANNAKPPVVTAIACGAHWVIGGTAAGHVLAWRRGCTQRGPHTPQPSPCTMEGEWRQMGLKSG